VSSTLASVGGVLAPIKLLASPRHRTVLCRIPTCHASTRHARVGEPLGVAMAEVVRAAGVPGRCSPLPCAATFLRDGARAPPFTHPGVGREVPHAPLAPTLAQCTRSACCAGASRCRGKPEQLPSARNPGRHDGHETGPQRLGQLRPGSSRTATGGRSGTRSGSTSKARPLSCRSSPAAGTTWNLCRQRACEEPA